MKVKICGVTSLEDALTCESLGADALGFVHYPGRSRSLPLATISDICRSMGPFTTRVLVCAPSSASEAVSIFEKSGADALQIYTLAPDQLAEIRASGINILRAVKPSREEALRYSAYADALVFECGTPGTGSSYDYTAVPVECHRKSIIAGGLNIHNIDIAKSVNPYALDVSSGVESSQGKKDPILVQEFIRRCKE